MRRRRMIRERTVSTLHHLKVEIEACQRHTHRIRRHRSVAAPFAFIQMEEVLIKELREIRREERARFLALLTRPSRAPGRIAFGGFLLKRPI